MNQIENTVKFVEETAAKVLAGITLDESTLYALSEIDTEDGRAAIIQAAKRISGAMCPRKFDTCSIVNARSGKCSENCKWCAQSAHFETGCESYALVDEQEARSAARYNAERGVGRLSLVASGRSVRGKTLGSLCDMLKLIKENDGIDTCASLGLLDDGELQKLWDSGVHRYHCNLETAPSYFPSLCTTHTQADKLATISAAKKIGFEICSGGIIGMGETRRQRMELAIVLRQISPCSIPINILSPIPGTPLENTPLISEDEVLLTIALFRFAHPSVQLRFAGGRARMSKKAQKEAMEIGINGAIVGDLLTTLGSTIAEDRALCEEAGYEW